MNRVGAIVHHSAGLDTEELQADDIWRFHTQERGWRGAGYHCVVEQVEGFYVAIRARPERMPGAHCKGKNYTHLGICFVGNFTETPPPIDQLRVGAEVLADWCAERGWDPAEAISAHRDHRSTECPGGAFPFEKLVQMVRERL